MPLKGIFARNNILSLFLILMGLWLIVPIMVSSLGLPITMWLWGTSNIDGVNAILTDPTRRELTDPLILYGFRIYFVFSGIGSLLAVLLFLHFIDGNPLSRMGAGTMPKPLHVLGAIVAMLAAMPLIAYTAELNQYLGLGNYMEETGNSLTTVQSAMIAQPDWLEFAFNILVFVVLAALWEEWIFRGLLQPMFAIITKNAHAGIWMSAALFSAIHLQFDGFLPRMLLGAVLGYLFFYGKTIWLPVIGHLFNNLFYLIADRMEQNGATIIDESALGTSPDLVLLIAGTAVLMILIYGFYRLSSKGKSSETKSAKLMEKDWVKVFATEIQYKAEIAKSLLEENGIDSIMINKRDSLYPFGEIEVYALKKDVLEAINVLKKSEI